ncbi:MAG: T9SS type A sorting domain-containing protein [Bacteroidia bacterium]
MIKYYTLTLLVLLVLNNKILGQWNQNPSLSTPVSVFSAGQKELHCVVDGKGGIIITWEDNRNNNGNSTDIYAQRLDQSGIPKWTSNGIVVCNNIAKQKNTSIVASSDGSAIITWEDDRAGNTDIYAQKIDSTGNPLWATNGVVICNKATTQNNPKVVSDNAGGAIIVWEDSANFYYDIYAQRINNLGVIQWTNNGVAICTSVNQQINPKIEEDGAGGAIITWQDRRNSNDYNIYAQRVDSNGQNLWTANGVVVCNALNTQNNPRIEPDGANGAYISWVDKRNGIDYDVYLQHINSNGTSTWTNNGVVVCNATGNQSGVDMKYLGTNGILISWKDSRLGLNSQIYYQLITTQGSPVVAQNGVQLSSGIKAANTNAILSANGEGVVVWQDSISLTGWDIMAQKISANGTILWSAGGNIVCNAPNDQVNASNVSDNNGGAIFAWEDYRNNSDYDIYANRIEDNSTGVSILQIDDANAARCFPNPVNSSTQYFTIISAYRTNSVIEIYNSIGKLIFESNTNNNGELLYSTESLSNGLYFVRLNHIEKNKNILEHINFVVNK